MFYHSVNAFGEVTETFETRDAALTAFFAGTVQRVFNTYAPGYHRELTKKTATLKGGQWVLTPPTWGECVANDV